MWFITCKDICYFKQYLHRINELNNIIYLTGTDNEIWFKYISQALVSENCMGPISKRTPLFVYVEQHFIKPVYTLMHFTLKAGFATLAYGMPMRNIMKKQSCHHGDPLMSTSPASPLFAQLLVEAQIKENIKAPRHWPLWGEFTGDWWIPRTKGQ